MKKVALGSIILIFSLNAGLVWAGSSQNLVTLGELIYKDKNLSAEKNQSCQTCHHPSAGYADPVNLDNPIEFPVSAGSVTDPAVLYGGRNAPSSAYAGFSPIFHLDKARGGYVGGMFWDGRATGDRLGDPLAEQALGPFKNPLEMAMTKDEVVNAVEVSSYSALFQRVFPGTNFDDIDGTYDNIGRAIAAFERSAAVTQFNSKFDQFWEECQRRKIDISSINADTDLTSLPAGILTVTQLKGLALFNDVNKGNCAACHATKNHTDDDGTIYPPLFTEYTYENIGIPTNWRVYDLYIGAPPDLGLGGREDLNDENQYGKFKVPTLRNVERTAPYGHNGYFLGLKEVVDFFNTGDSEEPEVPETVNETEGIGELGLTNDEVWQIVAFLKALTDQK